MIYKESKNFKKSDHRRNFHSLKLVFETLGIRSIMQEEEVQIMINPEETLNDLAPNYQTSTISDEYENQSLSSYFSRQKVVKRKVSVKTPSSMKLNNELVISIENTETPTKTKVDGFDPFQTAEEVRQEQSNDPKY